MVGHHKHIICQLSAVSKVIGSLSTLQVKASKVVFVVVLYRNSILKQMISLLILKLIINGKDSVN